MTTRAPVIGETSGRLTTELADTALGAEYDRFAMRGTANLAINENSALRVAAFSYDDSGLSYNAAKDEDSDYSSHGIRVRYLNELSERLTLNVIGDFGAYHRDEIPTLVMRYLPPESSIAQALADCGVTVSKENVDNCTVPDQTQSGFNAGSSVQFDYLFDDFDFTSITAYRKSSSDMKTAILGLGQFGIDNEVPIITVGAGRNGATGTVGPATGQNVDRDLFTQELRVNATTGDLEWFGGVYYQLSHYDQIRPSYLYRDNPSIPGYAVSLFSDTDTVTSAEASDAAIFADGVYTLSDDLRLIGGARYTKSKVSESQSGTTYAGPAGPGVTPEKSLDVSDGVVTWRLGGQYDLGERSMAYLTISTGFKAPQINDGTAFEEVESEIVTSYEMGLKKDIFDGNVGINGNIFFTKVENYQAQSCIPTTGPIPLSCTFTNVPDVETKGVEFEMFGSMLSGNRISLSMTYLDTEIKSEFLGADATQMKGESLNYAPKFKASLSAEQEFEVGPELAFVISGDVTYRDEQSMSLSADRAFWADASTLLNARVGLRSEKGWSLYLFGRNITDEVIPTAFSSTSAFQPGGVFQAISPTSKRLVGLQMEVNF